MTRCDKGGQIVGLARSYICMFSAQKDFDFVIHVFHADCKTKY